MLKTISLVPFSVDVMVQEVRSVLCFPNRLERDILFVFLGPHMSKTPFGQLSLFDVHVRGNIAKP